MSAVFALDATAAVRAVMDGAAQAALLDALAAAAVIVAPALLRIESANALFKYHRAGLLDSGEMLSRHAKACALVDRYVDEQTLFPESLQLAAMVGHSAYDAVYAVTARRHAATLLTFDRRLHAICAKEHIDCRLFGG